MITGQTTCPGLVRAWGLTSGSERGRRQEEEVWSKRQIFGQIIAGYMFLSGKEHTGT